MNLGCVINLASFRRPRLTMTTCNDLLSSIKASLRAILKKCTLYLFFLICLSVPKSFGSDSWSQIVNPNVNQSFTVAPLASGDLLFSFYYNWSTKTYSNACSIYHSNTNTWTPTGARGLSSIVMMTLKNGKVLGIDGLYSGYCELFDPATGAWVATGSFPAIGTGPGGGTYSKGLGSTLTLMPSEKILTTGGAVSFGFLYGAFLLPLCRIYDPATGVWTQTGNLLNARSSHSVTVLSSGKILVVGGSVNSHSTHRALFSSE